MFFGICVRKGNTITVTVPGARRAGDEREQNANLANSMYAQSYLNTYLSEIEQ